MSNTINFTEDAVEYINDMSIAPKDSKDVAANRAWIKAAFAEYEAWDEEKNCPVWRKHNADVLDRIKFVDENGEESEKIRNKSEDTIWEIAKNEVLRKRAFNFSFMQLNDEDRKKLLRADLSDAVAETALKVVGIQPVIERKIDGEIAAEELAKADAKLSIQALDKYLTDKGEAKVSKSAVIGAAIKESETMERHISYIEKKGYSDKVVNGFKKEHKKFGETMKKWWGKAWTMGKEYVANNRTRTIVDAAATLAVVLNPVSYGAVAAYAFYAAAGSLVWPIVEKRRKAIRRAKREGRSYNDYKLGLKFNGLRKAWKDIRTDEKEWKRYKNRAKMGAAAGLLIGGGLGALATGLVAGVGAATARIGGTIIRSAAAVTSQYMNFSNAKKDLKLDNSEENRADYNSAKTGLFVGGTIAALASAWGLYNILEAQFEAEAPSDNMKGTGGHTQETAQKVVKKATKAVKKVAEQDAPVAEVEVAYPPVWNAESGLSQKHFEEIYGKYDAAGKWHCGKITGILSRQNDAFDQWNEEHSAAPRQIEVKDPKEMYTSMMQNLHKARQADPTLFAGKTDDQVLYQYIKNVEYSERVANGPVVNGVPTLITITDKEGMPLFRSKQEELQAMLRILRCGEKGDVSSDAINGTLDRIDLKTGAGIGKEFSAKITNNSFWGYGEDCNNGVSMWRRGINAIKKVFTPEPEPEPEPEPVDVEAHSVQVVPLTPVDADVTSVYSETNVILGHGTSSPHDNDLTDEIANQNTKAGAVIRVEGSSRKISNVNFMKGDNFR